ncbi:MAG: exodeoxyribonuclease VII large subunit [Actinobacteria bacterium]|nr:exodeoxyribonuclease VII large subunit [Actinomycetota bacterium]MBM3713028.1 exodeoxyribonuclease VII large subunit [Actinomycetota bacterium]
MVYLGCFSLMDNLKNQNIHIYSVSELNFEIKKNLEAGFSSIWVEGEVSNCYCHNNRHVYFDLKDENSKMRIVMFHEINKNLLFKIENGLHLILYGYVSVYEKRGEYQFIALDAKPVGRGALLLAFEQLRAKLEKQGYFDLSRKKPLPVFPKKIGAVTSTGGAVIRDMISILSRRFENFNLIIRNVNVQGPSSEEEICSAIDDLCECGVDVIIIARGGGSLEDLWAFNTESVAQKVYRCSIPVISAVGHETDYTICDFVADFRAATPSVAAQVVIIDKAEVTENIKSKLNRIKLMVENKVNSSTKEYYFLTERKIFTRPKSIILDFWQGFDGITMRLREVTGKLINNKTVQVSNMQQFINKRKILDKIVLNRSFINNIVIRLFSAVRGKLKAVKNNVIVTLKDLQSNSPAAVLEKGFALVLDEEEKNVIKSISDIQVGQNININLKDGILLSKILNKINKKLGLEV